MFSGIVEASTEVLNVSSRGDVHELHLKRPTSFSDVACGDSVAVNGVCLTVEAFTETTMQFALGPETLRVTDWAQVLRPGLIMNLERSLRYGDRVHGHLMQGHVDGLGEVASVQPGQDFLLLAIRIPDSLKHLIWNKGTLAINGVSLTVNKLEANLAHFCLIPETLNRTNLKSLKTGDFVTLETDSLARYFDRMRELGLEYNTRNY